MDNILQVGEKVHIIERRYFESDLRRHIVGEIMKIHATALRIKGYVWVFDGNIGEFVRRSELRERVVVLGDRLTINVIPGEVELSEVTYVHDKDKGLFVTDEKDFRLEVNEFSVRS